jgi:hypothetical protein
MGSMPSLEQVLHAALDPQTPQLASWEVKGPPIVNLLHDPLMRLEEATVAPVTSVEWATGRGPRVTRWIVLHPQACEIVLAERSAGLSVGCRAAWAAREETAVSLRGADILRCADVPRNLAWFVGRTEDGFVKMEVRFTRLGPSVHYEDLELPELPEPWFWEKGEDDGDPVAARLQGGWRTSVYEANACGYTDELVVLHRCEEEGTTSSSGIPFPVFAAVNLALQRWYGID